VSPPYDACEKVPATVSSLSLVRYRRNDYSVPTCFGHRQVMVRGYVHEVAIACGTEIIARHPRSYEREDFVFDPLHYLALIERKINVLDQAAPLAGWQLPEALLQRLRSRTASTAMRSIAAGWPREVSDERIVEIVVLSCCASDLGWIRLCPTPRGSMRASSARSASRRPSREPT
jgi:hypothetical protein